MSIEAVLQPGFHCAMNYFSFDAEVLFAFFVFGDTFFMLGLMVHIGLGSDRRRLEDLFEKSDMKMENGNMGSESKKVEMLQRKYMPVFGKIL